MKNPVRDPGTLSTEEVHRYVGMLQSKNGMERQKARIALVTLGIPAIDFFAELATHPEDTVRWEAVKGLGQMMDPITAPLLINALEDENTAVRWLAAEGLIKLNKKGLLPLLEALTRQKITIFLREGAHHVVKAMARKYPSEQIGKLIKSLDKTTDHSNVPLRAQEVIDLIHPVK
jgi:HEAT repeat protein